MKETIQQVLRRIALGILPPRFCKYTDKDGAIEFGVICNLFKAMSEAERSRVADCVRELHEESYFQYKKDWITETSEENGEIITYTYPPYLIVRSE